VRLVCIFNFSSPDAEMTTAGDYFDGQQLITARFARGVHQST